MTERPLDESLLEARFSPLRAAASGEWRDVERRARRARRLRATLLAAAALAATVAIVPASGLSGRIVDLIWSPSAPPEVQDSFAATDAMREKLFAAAAEAGATLRDSFSPVIADQGRGIFAIETADGSLYLWAAPTADGRECWLLQAGADASTGRPRGFQSCDERGESRPLRPEIFWTAERPSVTIVIVRVYDDSITRVEVESASAPPTMLQVVAGYALGTIPKGDRATAFIGHAADGTEVARVAVPPGP